MNSTTSLVLTVSLIVTPAGPRDHQRFGLVEVAGDQVAALILAKERGRCRASSVHADARGLGHLERGQRQPAIGQVGAGA
jgi:hypothetical protein